VRLTGSLKQTTKRASGQCLATLFGATGQASACTEQSIFTPSPLKQPAYLSQSGSRASLPKVPLWVAISFGSFGSEMQIPGCCSIALASHVVPDLGAPSRKAPTSGTKSSIIDTTAPAPCTI
ncbi:uncharacterized protein METZ01_LOCUS93481, partial [marine metagenome]